jgi:hypothetical protein
MNFLYVSLHVYSWNELILVVPILTKKWPHIFCDENFSFLCASKYKQCANINILCVEFVMILNMHSSVVRQMVILIVPRAFVAVAMDGVEPHLPTATGNKLIFMETVVPAVTIRSMYPFRHFFFSGQGTLT